VRYALITPARNEEDFLELTIQSVVNQTVRPVRWVIVSDGSTDRTDEIASRHAAAHDWIDFVRMPPRQVRDFAGKVGSFNAGLARLTDVPYDIIGSLDADISFEPDYFEFLLRKFEEDPKLGLGGTPFDEGGETYDYRFSSLDHVSGACQLFRRRCYEEIGGYVPMKGGGIDVVAVLSARMRGWRTRTFPEKRCIHHRPMGSANDRRRFSAHFNLGQRAYRLGFHPLWQVFRSAYQMTREPYVVGGVALFAGYFWAMLKRVERPVPKDLVAFQQQDQMRRLREFVFRSRAPAAK
jgi:poly-beta-1,6-N-acetyl-D-glucosamine synthase